MKTRINNQLNMVGTCIGIATAKENKAVWAGKEPADFDTDLGHLQTSNTATTGKIALLDGATGGATDAKAAAETILEDSAFVLTRALANHYKKTGNLLNLGKTDLAKRDLVRLSGQPLVAKATEIRDLGITAQTETDAAKRGVTAARVDAVIAALTAYQPLMNSPRGQIVNHSTLLKEIETDTANLLDQLNGLDDLILQFDGTDAGKHFIEAWTRARTIVDAGHGHVGTTPTPAPAPATTPPAPTPAK